MSSLSDKAQYRSVRSETDRPPTMGCDGGALADEGGGHFQQGTLEPRLGQPIVQKTNRNVQREDAAKQVKINLVVNLDDGEEGLRAVAG